MAADEKSAYEELENRVIRLEEALRRGAVQRKETEKRLRESEKKYRHLFHEAQVALFRTRVADGALVDLNERYAEMAGYTSVEECRRKFNPGRAWADPEARKRMTEILKRDGSVRDFEAEIVRADGVHIWIRFSASIYPEPGLCESPCHLSGISRSGGSFCSVSKPVQGFSEANAGTGHVVGPVTDRHLNPLPGTTGSSAASDRNFHDSLCPKGHDCYIEGSIEDITNLKKANEELEQVNTALKVLLGKRDRDRADMEENIHYNCETLVFPILEQLKNKPEPGDRQNLLSVLESSLKEVLSPFSKHLNDPMHRLTPTEVRIAALIKQGLSSKEIAGILKISVRTVTGHRDHIRKKLGLRNSKANLRTYLSSLK